MSTGNPFLRQTSSGVPIPKPLIGPGGGLDPGVINLARAYSKEARETVTSDLSSRGLESSTFLPALQERAFRGGFQQAVGNFQQQQGLYNQWAQGLFQLKAAQQAEPREPTWWERALEVALPIASVGASIYGASQAGKAPGGGNFLSRLFGGGN